MHLNVIDHGHSADFEKTSKAAWRTNHGFSGCLPKVLDKSKQDKSKISSFKSLLDMSWLFQRQAKDISLTSWRPKAIMAVFELSR
jgi:hypothetical protein